MELISCVWFTDWTSPNCMAKGDLAQWHESSKILKVISGSPRGCFAWHASWGSAGDALTNTSHASNTQNVFYLDLEKGCAALLDKSHRSPESTLWSILQEVSRCANAGVADWRSLQDFATCWKGGFAGNSFEQFWTTGCLWTSVSNLSQNDKSTWKWCGLSLSFETVQHDFDHVLYPSHPVRQVHAPMVQTEVPKEVEAKNNEGFFLKFRYTIRSCSFEKLRWLVWRWWNWFHVFGSQIGHLPTAWTRAT